MKFEEINLDAAVGTVHDEKGTPITKVEVIRDCDHCHSYTRWYVESLSAYICSQECLIGKRKGTEPPVQVYLDKYRPLLMKEMECFEGFVDDPKDILVVVHNQLDLLKECVEAIQKHTRNYKLYIWDNASDEDTSFYIAELAERGGCEYLRSPRNQGFIEPNNEMARWGQGEYIILLNSDTRVAERWSDLLLSYLQKNTEVAAVGYGGGLLDESGQGGTNTVGPDIDFVNGWCLCFSRKTYQEFGLFSPELQFAYGEDADFSLRLKEAGRKVYALATPLVFHHGSKTIKAVAAEKKIDVKTTFAQNHEYIRRRWADYLKTKRVLAG